MKANEEDITHALHGVLGWFSSLKLVEILSNLIKKREQLDRYSRSGWST